MDKYKLINNTDEEQYEFHIDGFMPHVVYRMHGEAIYLMHTEVPPQLEGKGIASHLIEAVLKDIDARHLKMVPYCQFVIAYIQRHPGWKRLAL